MCWKNNWCMPIFFLCPQLQFQNLNEDFRPQLHIWNFICEMLVCKKIYICRFKKYCFATAWLKSQFFQHSATFQRNHALQLFGNWLLKCGLKKFGVPIREPNLGGGAKTNEAALQCLNSNLPKSCRSLGVFNCIYATFFLIVRTSATNLYVHNIAEMRTKAAYAHLWKKKLYSTQKIHDRDTKGGKGGAGCQLTHKHGRWHGLQGGLKQIYMLSWACLCTRGLSFLDDHKRPEPLVIDIFEKALAFRSAHSKSALWIHKVCAGFYWSFVIPHIQWKVHAFTKAGGLPEANQGTIYFYFQLEYCR